MEDAWQRLGGTFRLLRDKECVFGIHLERFRKIIIFVSFTCEFFHVHSSVCFLNVLKNIVLVLFSLFFGINLKSCSCFWHSIPFMFLEYTHINMLSCFPVACGWCYVRPPFFWTGASSSSFFLLSGGAFLLSPLRFFSPSLQSVVLFVCSLPDLGGAVFPRQSLERCNVCC